MAGEVCSYPLSIVGDLTSLSVLPPLPQRLGAIALAFQVEFELHFLLLFVDESLIENLISIMEMMEAKISRTPRKSPNIQLANSRTGKSLTGASVAAYRRFWSVDRCRYRDCTSCLGI